jgi:multiple antibiotic resistance protein
MHSLINSFLLVYATLFPIVNPLGSAPIYLTLTEGCSDEQRNSLAWRVAVGSFFLLLGSLLIGSHVLGFFGVSTPVVRIGGGLVVTAFGWKLLNSDNAVDDHTQHLAPATMEAFYPLTMPLTVGPGSMSVAITLGSQRPRTGGLEHQALLAAGAVAGILATAASVYLCYRFARNLAAMLGKTGANILVRLSAFILLCIGIQIMWGGWSELSASH